MMKRSTPTFFLLLHMLIQTMGIQYGIGQTRQLQLLHAEDGTPVVSASIYFVGKKSGTVSDDNGIVRLGRVGDERIRITHLNFETLEIQAADLKKDLTTIRMNPKSAIEMEEILLAPPTDRLLIGQWRLIRLGTVFLDEKGREVVSGRPVSSGNIKEYTQDGRLIIHNSRGTRQLEGTFAAVDNHIHENITFSRDRFLQGLTNVLYYTVDHKKKRMMVRYILPGQTTVTEELWERRR